MVLTTIDEAEAPQVARDLLNRSEVQDSPTVVNRAIIEMISIIMTYKFMSMSRQEVEAMLDITIQETRVLAIALLHFKTMADLETWLAEQSD